MTDNPSLKTLVPQHHRSVGLPGTPEMFDAEVKKLGLPLKVLNPKVGQTYKISGTGEVK